MQLLLKLPDGTEKELVTSLGQTVQYVKAVVQEEHDLPMTKQVCAAALLTDCAVCQCSGARAA